MRLLVLLAFLALPATASACSGRALITASPDETIAQVARPTPVDAWAGRIAYGAYDTATDRYALMVKTGAAAPAPAPVAPKRSSFDVDLGSAASGHASAIYPAATPAAACMCSIS